MRSIFILILSTLFISSLSAQIVNVEKKRKNSGGFQAVADFEFSLKETGSQIVQLANNIDLQYNKKAHTFIFLNNISFMRVDGGNLFNNGFQHLRYNYTFKDSSFLTLEAFSQFQYNDNKLLKERILGGGGLRFRIIKTENFHWFIAPLVMYEHEKLSNETEDLSELIRGDAYNNIYLKLGKIVTFSNIVYYQPAFNNFNDYRLSSDASLRFNITKYFSYDVGFSVEYDNEPPAEVQKMFYQFKNKLVFKF